MHMLLINLSSTVWVRVLMVLIPMIKSLGPMLNTIGQVGAHFCS